MGCWNRDIVLCHEAVPPDSLCWAGEVLQTEWIYLQHIMPIIEGALAPLEEAIQKVFLPAFLRCLLPT
eukprot:scaffold331369_cov43-Attheya_sp.AAC.1